MPLSTPYPDVNAVLRQLLQGAQAVLGDQFVGLYLYGSLASGDFDPAHSDIDFVVVTANALTDETVAALKALHTRLAASSNPWAKKLEGTYLPQHALPRYDPDAAPCPSVNEGEFYLARHESDWIIQRYVLREYGVAVAGPPLHLLIEPVTPDDLRRAVQGILREWWQPMWECAEREGDVERLRGGDYQAYAILTMCRALYTLCTGDFVSKPVAARWAQQELAQWQALIAWARAWQPGTPADKLNETLDLIRFTLEYNPPTELLDRW